MKIHQIPCHLLSDMFVNPNERYLMNSPQTMQLLKRTALSKYKSLSLALLGRALHASASGGDERRGEVRDRKHDVDEQQDERPEQSAHHSGPGGPSSRHHSQNTGLCA